GNGNGNNNSGSGPRNAAELDQFRDPERVVIVDLDQRIVYSGLNEFNIGDQVTASEARRQIPIKSNRNETVGFLIVDDRPPRLSRNSDAGPETAFLDAVQSASLLSALGAGMAAILIGVVLANTLTSPLRELTSATQAVAEGNLGYQVDIKSRDEIGSLASAFNQMSHELDESQKMRRQMTADIAHDLRTPLSVILGYTEALSDGKLQGDPEIYTSMYQEAQQLNHLIDDLRTLSLADAGELTLNRAAVPVADLFQRAHSAFRMQAEQQQVTLEVEETSNLNMEVNVDRDRFAQVFTNLISNALRYTPAGGVVSLSAKRVGEWISLRISDTGSGISSEHLPYIFERFYRADQSRNQSVGESGLGLAIVKSLVEAHGGRISATSEINRGTAFIIDLPTKTA
ncbi:MAG: ATP-binding protein, partial [Chloroflexota bacterium]